MDSTKNCILAKHANFIFATFPQYPLEFPAWYEIKLRNRNVGGENRFVVTVVQENQVIKQFSEVVSAGMTEYHDIEVVHGKNTIISVEITSLMSFFNVGTVTMDVTNAVTRIIECGDGGNFFKSGQMECEVWPGYTA